MKILSVILIVLSILILFFGFTFAKGAPQETVFVGLACFLGIMSRICQASWQHKEIRDKN